MGQPRTQWPWRKILVVVESIYLMEREYCNLLQIVKVCKSYGAYVHLDILIWCGVTVVSQYEDTTISQHKIIA